MQPLDQRRLLLGHERLCERADDDPVTRDGIVGEEDRPEAALAQRGANRERTERTRMRVEGLSTWTFRGQWRNSFSGNSAAVRDRAIVARNLLELECVTPL
jgi:hypothetical protein